jgi:hypothetical protein
MSFDLYFCSPKSGRVDFDAVAAWAQERGPFVRNPHQLWYSNEDTGVYFSLDFEPNEPETPEDARVPEGVFDSGLSFNLNFNRPSFFGHEAMPYVEQLARRFNLRVFNPQSNAPNFATEAEAKNLTESWLDHNRRAILTLTEQEPSFANSLYMPLEHSLYLWRFRMAKEKLKLICGEELYLPRLTPVHQKDSKVVSRAFTCTQGVPTIVPENEWVFVVRGKKSFFKPKGKPEVGVIGRETFDKLLEGYIEPFEFSETEVQVIRAESVKKVGDLLRSLERMLGRPEFEVVGADSFVDIELPKKT